MTSISDKRKRLEKIRDKANLMLVGSLNGDPLEVRWLLSQIEAALEVMETAKVVNEWPDAVLDSGVQALREQHERFVGIVNDVSGFSGCENACKEILSRLEEK